VADLFPLVLSIITLIVVVNMLFLDFAVQNSFTARPPFIIGSFSVLSIFWLAFNAFSTSRWRNVPLSCDTIPAGYVAEKTWCQDLQALKAIVWVEWLTLTFSLLFITRYTLTQHSNGQAHIWKMPLSRFSPRLKGGGNPYRGGSDFLHFPDKPW